MRILIQNKGKKMFMCVSSDKIQTFSAFLLELRIKSTPLKNKGRELSQFMNESRHTKTRGWDHMK